MNDIYKIINHQFDVLVIGAGGSGLRAALGCVEQGLKTLRDPLTVARQRGITLKELFS